MIGAAQPGRSWDGFIKALESERGLWGIRHVPARMVWRNRTWRERRGDGLHNPPVLTWTEAAHRVCHSDTAQVEDRLSYAIKTGRPVNFIARVKLSPHKLSRFRVYVWPVHRAEGRNDGCWLLLEYFQPLPHTP